MKEHGSGWRQMRLRSNVNLEVISLNHTGFNCAARLGARLSIPRRFEK
jgi:hypothetical protein